MNSDSVRQDEWIPRAAGALARTLAGEFKVVAIVGPRQAGKTTLARRVFPGRPYVSLEDPDELRFAREDPRRFLGRLDRGAIIDEAQRCPELFSYLQGVVDASPEPGRFILTGSQHFGLMASIGQSLAGRVGFLRLLPFSHPELRDAGIAPASLDALLYRGGYPPVYGRAASPERWYGAYAATYVERDVRQLVNVRDLATFQLFVRLCAANVGQLVNLSRLGADAGIDQKTARAWLGILEASFIVFRLAPHHRNFRKRLVKAPKLYFYDTGLAARLLGVDSPEQLATHPLRGALFECWVMTELLKGRGARGKPDNLFFWRDHVGHEVDALADQGTSLRPIEIKAGGTVAADWFDGLSRWMALAGKAGRDPTLVYGGDRSEPRGGVRVVPWRDIGALAETV
jgi:predicted AAA+ superfamily ATPase